MYRNYNLNVSVLCINIPRQECCPNFLQCTTCSCQTVLKWLLAWHLLCSPDKNCNYLAKMCAEQVGDQFPPHSPFPLLSTDWENNMTESSVIYFPPSLSSWGTEWLVEGCKTNRRPTTTGNFVIDVAARTDTCPKPRRLHLWLRLWLMKCMQIQLQSSTWLGFDFRLMSSPCGLGRCGSTRHCCSSRGVAAANFTAAASTPLSPILHPLDPLFTGVQQAAPLDAANVLPFAVWCW